MSVGTTHKLKLMDYILNGVRKSTEHLVIISLALPFDWCINFRAGATLNNTEKTTHTSKENPSCI